VVRTALADAVSVASLMTTTEARVPGGTGFTLEKWWKSWGELVKTRGKTMVNTSHVSGI